MEKEDTEEASQIGRLIAWNRLWLSLLVLLAAAWRINAYLVAFQLDMKTLKVRGDGQGLRLSSVTDGSFVVTHLIDERSQCWAELPRPIAVIDSFGAYITSDDIKKLKWRDRQDQPSAFSGSIADITALYYRPLTAMHRTEH